MERRSSSVNSLRGHLWATGKNVEGAEAPLKKAGKLMGRQWFAVTAFPLFAGTFGSIATALNVCALVQPWRCLVLDGLFDLKDIPDPNWLISTNAFSLFFGCIANIAMLPIMGNGTSALLKVGLTTLMLITITIVSGFLAAAILIVLIIATTTRLQFPSLPEHAYTQAYYYAIMAAILYAVTSAFIVYTAYVLHKSQWSRDQIKKQLSRGHGSLKLLTMVFMAYLLLGALVYSKIEGWSYLDAVFWADVTLLTIGFGDIKPITHLGRALLFPYAFFGVFILVLIVYCISRVVFERGRSSLELHLRDKDRIQHVKRRAIESRKSTPSKPDDLAAPAQQRKSRKARAAEEREIRQRDFNTMRVIILRASRRRILYSMVLWTFFALFLWLGGAVVFHLAELGHHDWSYFDAVYFTFISILAIGYGDETLQSMLGKSFFVLWSLIVVPTLTMLVSTASEAVGIPYLTGLQEWYMRHHHSQNPPQRRKHLSKSLIPIDQLPNNTHDKNHLLVRAIRRVAIDHIKSQEENVDPDYTFEDWEYIFYLMEVLEPVPEEKNGVTGARRLSGLARSGMEEWAEGGQILDWLHGKNPLNVGETLTEWVLLSLVDKLEAELLELRKELGNTAEK